jgi:D-alanine-D-alanine ligase
MGHQPLRVVVLHNRDFDPRDSDPEASSRADVENAARDVVRALVERGHVASLFAVAGDADPATAATAALGALRELAPDLVFNLCESLGGDARHEIVLPTLLDAAGLRYTGSGPLALGLALRKDVTKQLLRARAVPTPPAFTVEDDAVDGAALGFPLIVKPAREDASVGISCASVVHDQRALDARVAEVRTRYRQPALVERFVDGRELYVSLIGNDPPEALPMHEIDFSAMPPDRPRIVSYEGKWDTSSVEYHGTRPVRAVGLDDETRGRCEAAARAAFAALELRDYARVDLRLAPDGTPYVIDVNPNCDLSDGAGVSRAASFGGLTYPDLIERICEAAIARYRRESEESCERDRAPVVGDTGHPPPPAERPRWARTAGGAGRAVQQGGGVGRARADRRRAR